MNSSNNVTEHGTIIVTLDEYKFYAVIELSLFVTGQFPFYFFALVFYRAPTFHRNMNAITINLMFCAASAMLSRMIVLYINYLRLVQGQFLYFYEGDCWPENPITALAFFFHALFVQTGFLNLISSVLERLVAIVNVMHYERDTRIGSVVSILLIQWIQATIVVTLASRGIIACRWLYAITVIINVFAFGLYQYMNRWSRLQYEKPDRPFPSLSERYQLEENLKAARLINPTIKSLISFLVIAALVLTVGGYFDKRLQFLMQFHGFNITLAISGNLQLLSGLFLVDAWRQEAFRILRFCKSAEKTKKHVIRSNEEEQEMYFRALQRQWK